MYRVLARIKSPSDFKARLRVIFERYPIHEHNIPETANTVIRNDAMQCWQLARDQYYTEAYRYGVEFRDATDAMYAEMVATGDTIPPPPRAKASKIQDFLPDN